MAAFRQRKGSQFNEAALYEADHAAEVASQLAGKYRAGGRDGLFVVQIRPINMAELRSNLADHGIGSDVMMADTLIDQPIAQTVRFLERNRVMNRLLIVHNPDGRDIPVPLRAMIARHHVRDGGSFYMIVG
jgi:hypothetical protein